MLHSSEGRAEVKGENDGEPPLRGGEIEVEPARERLRGWEGIDLQDDS